MSTTTEAIAHKWAMSVFIFIAIGVCCFLLLLGYFFGGRSQCIEKNIPFESGIHSVGSARFRCSVQFYLVCILFVIFDAEALYLYAWSVSILDNGWVGFLESAMFILVLLTSLVYLMRISALDWTPAPYKCLRKW